MNSTYEAWHIITVWDRRSTKTDRVTNRNVPDETKRVPLLTYSNPRPAVWPEADYIVGNPPFIGKVKLREDLGDGYAETLRATYPEVPESADFVLYWWHKAAKLVRGGKATRFGLVTTNSLRQTFARRVVQMHLKGSPLPTASRGIAGSSQGAPSLSEGGSLARPRELPRHPRGPLVRPREPPPYPGGPLARRGEPLAHRGGTAGRIGKGPKPAMNPQKRLNSPPLSLLFTIPDQSLGGYGGRSRRPHRHDRRCRRRAGGRLARRD